MQTVRLHDRRPTHHPTRGLAGTALVGAVPRTEDPVKSGLIQDPGQVEPLMARINHVFQAVSEEVVGFGNSRGPGTHSVI